MRRRLTPKQKEARRLRAMRALERGLTQSEVAAKLGTSVASVSNWAFRFRTGGVDELLARRPGRPPRTQQPLKGIEGAKQAVMTRHPDELGLAGSLWSWRAVQALAFRSRKTEISRWTVLRYLRDWGLQAPTPPTELVAPQPRNRHAPRTRASGRGDVVAEMRSRARELGGMLCFVACTDVELDHNAHDPSASKRIVLWSLGRRGEAAFTTYTAPLRTTDIVDFFERLLVESNAPVLAIVPATLCSAPAVVDWLKQRENEIRLHPVKDEPIANSGIGRARENGHESQS